VQSGRIKLYSYLICDPKSSFVDSDLILDQSCRYDMQITKQRQRQYDAFYKKSGIRLGPPPVLWVKADQDEMLVAKAKEAAQQGSPNRIPDILRAIAAFPNEPMCLNYLCIAYQRHGMESDLRAGIDRMLAQFPDYAYAKLAKAQYLIDEDRPDEAATLLGSLSDPHLALTDRQFIEEDLFSVYALGASRVAIALGDINTAQLNFERLSEILPYHKNTELLRMHLRRWELKNDMATIKKIGSSEEDALRVISQIVRKHLSEFDQLDTSPIPTKAKALDTNIAQNANCPCGSGKKYKRCCAN
jgi:SEC-C motif